MDWEEFSLDAFRTGDKEVADFVAFLTNSVPYYEKESGEYRLLSDKDVQSLVEELYEEGQYDRAEELLDSRWLSALIESEERSKGILEPMKELRKVKSKSFRISGIQFVKLVSTAYEKEISVADVIRVTLSDLLQEELENISNCPEVNEKRLERLEELLAEWKSRKSKKPKGVYTPQWETTVNEEIVKSFEHFSEYIVRKRLDEILEDPKLVDIYTKHWIFASDTLFETFSLELFKRDSELTLAFADSTPILSYTMVDELENLEDFLSDIAHAGYNSEDVSGLPLFKQLPRLSKLVDKIKNEEIEELRDYSLSDVEMDKVYDNIDFMYQRYGLKRLIRVSDESITWGDIPLTEENLASLKEDILENLVDEDIYKLDYEDAKEKVMKFIESGERDKAKRISYLSKVRKASEKVAERIAEIMINAFSSQVVSLTMPEGLDKLMKVSELDKNSIVPED